MNLEVIIRLSFQRALIGNISKNVRGICCDWDNHFEWFRVVFYLDILPNEEEKELQSIIMTEFHNDIQEFKKFYEDCYYSNKPFGEIDKLRMVIYWRNERKIFSDDL